MNHAHKRGLFEDIDELRIMKDVKNTAVHEYIEDEDLQKCYKILEELLQKHSRRD